MLHANMDTLNLFRDTLSEHDKARLDEELTAFAKEFLHRELLHSAQERLRTSISGKNIAGRVSVGTRGSRHLSATNGNCFLAPFGANPSWSTHYNAGVAQGACNSLRVTCGARGVVLSRDRFRHSFNFVSVSHFLFRVIL